MRVVYCQWVVVEFIGVAIIGGNLVDGPLKNEPMPRRKRNPRGQGELLRKEIMKAAADLLAEERDISKLTLRGVAKRVGIAAPSVYLHFPDVDHLKVALVQTGFEALEQARAEASQNISNPCEVLLARVCAYAIWGIDNPGLYLLMFGPNLPSTLAYGVDQSPGQKALLNLAQNIKRCQQGTQSPRNDNPEQTATLTWAAVHGLVMLHIDRPNFPWAPIENMVSEIVRRMVGLGQ